MAQLRTLIFTVYLLQAIQLFAQAPTLVKNINPTPTGNSSPQNFIRFNNLLFFTADDGVLNKELWRTDGTSAGTQLVKDLYPGGSSGGFNRFTSYKNYLYFASGDPGSGNKLWRSDGTANGTAIFFDKENGRNFDVLNTEKFKIYNNELYFITLAAPTRGS